MFKPIRSVITDKDIEKNVNIFTYTSILFDLIIKEERVTNQD